MKYDDAAEYKGRFVKILLKNTYRYTGTIKEINSTSLKIFDKFSEIVTIDLDDIAVITPTTIGWEGTIR